MSAREAVPYPARVAVRRVRAALRASVHPLPRLDRYQPEPALRRPLTTVPAAAVPCVDAHNHLGRWLTDGRWAAPDVGALLALLDRLQVETVVNLDGRWGRELEANLDRYDRAHPGRFLTFCHVDWQLLRERDPGERLADSLAESVGRGARGLKVWKDLGLSVRDQRGRRVLPDDERLVPLWARAAELGVPVLVHTGDPVAFFSPVDRRNERLEELRRFPRLALHRCGIGYAELADSFERLVAANPATTFIGAHVAGAAEDLDHVEDLLRRYPNLHVDLAGRSAELGRRPRAAARLLCRHPDRVLFGTDVYPPRAEELELWFRLLETEDEYFPYSAGVPGSGRWAVYGLGLPREVLEPVYRGNARRLLGLGAAEPTAVPLPTVPLPTVPLPTVAPPTAEAADGRAR